MVCIVCALANINYILSLVLKFNAHGEERLPGFNASPGHMGRCVC